MSNYENNKKIQYIDFLKLVEIEVLTITSIIAVYYLFIVITEQKLLKWYQNT